MEENWSDTVSGVDGLNADSGITDAAHKKLATDPASDSGSGILDDIGSDLVEGVFEAAGNAVGAVIDVAGELLGGLFD